MAAVYLLDDRTVVDGRRVRDDGELDELLQELRELTGEDWIIPVTHRRVRRWFGSKTVTDYQLFADAHGEWQLMGMETGRPGYQSRFTREQVMNFVLGMLTQLHERRKSEPEDGPHVRWVVADNGERRMYRSWADLGPDWTFDQESALQFARRADAEVFAAEDPDAWRIIPIFPELTVDATDFQTLLRLKECNTWDGARPVLGQRSDEETKRAFDLSDRGLIAIEQVAHGVRLHITRLGALLVTRELERARQRGAGNVA